MLRDKPMAKEGENVCNFIAVRDLKYKILDMKTNAFHLGEVENISLVFFFLC